MTKSDYVLWLPSWYPNEYEKFNGDFIQRHAQATSLFIPIHVIHFVQLGNTIAVEESKIVESESGQLKEIIVYLKFTPSGISVFDKFLFNFLFYRNANRYLKSYFKQFGFPKLLHVHVPMKAGNVALWAKRNYKINYIVSEQSSFYMHSAPNNFYQKNFLHRMQVKRIFKNAYKVSNVSATIGQMLVKLFNLKEIATIHNTVNTSLFNLSFQKLSKFTFIHVSTLTEQKNIFGILNAYSKLLDVEKNCTLKIIGPIRKEIVEKIHSLRLHNSIELVGEVSYIEVSFHMKRSHALVMFSRHENFPCVIVEALCCGLTVVSSNVAGIKECINSSNGILVDSENEAQLTEAMLKIIKNFSAYNSEKISAQASELYNYRSIGEQFFDLYRSIFDKKG